MDFHLIFRGSVVRRAAVMAAIVGCIIAAINHGNHIWAGTMSISAWVKVGITFFVPYTVSTISSVLALREQDRLIETLRETQKANGLGTAGGGLPTT
ncbi:nitrate/nitrite transporter NrtS [Roseobacter weihaiensis]|uniref:nitrate/nitrite transporter NrtS n=1 Tax=Roseobacter weihaiensis TaxID=2763262 RepID=UPI001D09FDDE|nr:nitrate/nitrite transporter NrtS [Roseobacter sp. H9]